MFTPRGREPEPLRIDLSFRFPAVASDDPGACPDCRGTGTVRAMQVKMVGPEEFDNTPGERPCERCKGVGLDPEPPAEPA